MPDENKDTYKSSQNSCIVMSWRFKPGISQIQVNSVTVPTGLVRETENEKLKKKETKKLERKTRWRFASFGIVGRVLW